MREEAEAAAAGPIAVSPEDPPGLTVGPAVERLVVTLPPKERACVLLKDVFDYSLEEISELVGSSVGAVKAALNRGRSKLAKLPDAPLSPPPAKPPRAPRSPSCCSCTSNDSTAATGTACVS